MRVVALEKFEYANQLRLAGDEFDTTSESDGKLLILAKRVKAAQVQTRAMKAEDEQPPMTTENSKPITPLPKKNRYQHRAMRAEE